MNEQLGSGMSESDWAMLELQRIASQDEADQRHALAEIHALDYAHLPRMSSQRYTPSNQVRIRDRDAAREQEFLDGLTIAQLAEKVGRSSSPTPFWLRLDEWEDRQQGIYRTVYMDFSFTEMLVVLRLLNPEALLNILRQVNRQGNCEFQADDESLQHLIFFLSFTL